MCVCPDDGTEVGKRDERATLFVVLNNPLGLLFAKGGGRSDGLADSLAGSYILDDNCTRLGARGSNSQFNHVSSRDGDAGEVVGVVWVPLVPGWKKNVRVRFR